MRSLARLSFAVLAGASASAAAILACSSNDAATGATTQADANTPAVEAAAAAPDAADAHADVADAGADAKCPPLKNDTPKDLACTGLFANIANKQVADGIREFTPAVPFWSDGADKTRWVQLPTGTQIDTTNADEWNFPIGTKLWKEFRVDGHRIETRLFEKVGTNQWVHASYAWSADELSATRADGADFLVSGANYHIPTPSECDKCHDGRRDRVLGFSAISLGLPNAAGYTLSALANDGRLKPTPTTTSYTIPDDGSGQAAAALGWLHINCGVSCHNSNTTAAAYPTGLRMRLAAADLTAATPDTTWDVLKTSLDVGAVTPRWSGMPRISPGQPDMSLLVQLISERGTDQMPPIATDVVDDKDVAVIRSWITSMPVTPPDGG